MALKFNCPECGTELVVRFLSQGEEARCRNCDSFITVPEDAIQVDSQISVLSPPRKRTTSITHDPASDIVPPFGFALRQTWEVIKANYDIAIGTAVLFFAGSLASGTIQYLVEGYVEGKIAKYIFGFLVGTLVFTPIRVGTINIAIGFAFESKAAFKDYLATAGQYVKYILGYFIYWAIALIGLVLFIVPGVILAIRFQFFDYFILKYNSGVVESFKRSSTLTAGLKSKLLGFNIASILFMMSGLLALCVGYYITIPISIGAIAFIFRRLIKKKGLEPTDGKEPVEYEVSESRPQTAVKAGAYPTISQAIMLTLTYISLLIILFIPLGIFEGIIGISFTDNFAISTFLEILCLGIIIWFVMKKAKLKFGEVVALKSFNPWLIIALTIAIAGLSIVNSEIDNLLNFIIRQPAWIEDIFKELRSDMVNYLVLAVVLAPITEEILFRGIIVRGFSRNYTFKSTLLVSAAIFAVIHMNPWQFISAFSGGIILGWIFLETKSLIPCIFAHALYNSFDLILYKVFHLRIPGYIPVRFDVVSFQPWWFDITGIILTSVGVYGLYMLFKRNSRNGSIDSGNLRQVDSAESYSD